MENDTKSDALASSSRVYTTSSERRMFYTELKFGETTIISWKKFLKERGNEKEECVLTNADPTTTDIAVVEPLEVEMLDARPSNRFSSVVKKIESLYMGKQSCDEDDVDDMLSDHQYATDDSFIDDAELDEYIEADNLSTAKHGGFFVNSGELEKTDLCQLPNMAPIKGKNKVSKSSNINTDDKHILKSRMAMDYCLVNAAKRYAPSNGNQLSTPAKMQNVTAIYYQGGTFRNSVNDFGKTCKKRSVKSMSKYKNASSVKASQARFLQKPGSATNQATLVYSQAESLPKISWYNDSDGEFSNKKRRKETGKTYSIQKEQPSCTNANDGSATKLKDSILERAIIELEKIVSLCKPSNLDFQEVGTSYQGIKKGLPSEVKQKLAKVAKLSAGHSVIPKNILVNRLMGIVGHLIQRKTLEKNMQEMVDVRISPNQEKGGRIQQMKHQVNEMIGARLSFLKSTMTEQQRDSDDDFVELNDCNERRLLRKYGMDKALEDKLCDLYDHYLEGIDKDKYCRSSMLNIRSLLYGEIAEMCSNGMDVNVIKEAINRSKERKRSRIKNKIREERRKREMNLGVQIENNSTQQERLSMDPITAPKADALPSKMESTDNIWKQHEKSQIIVDGDKMLP